MKYFYLLAVLSIFVLGTDIRSVLAQHGKGGHEDVKDVTHGRKIDGLIKEFMQGGQVVEGHPDGDRPVKFEKNNYYQALVVTKADNPFLTDECRKAAVAMAVESIGKHGHGGHDDEEKGRREEEHEEEEHGEEEDGGDAAIQAAAEHMKEHQDFISEYSMSYAEYLKEISECKEFCGPLIASLELCHIDAVARSYHGIVLFALNSSVVSSEQSATIVALANQLRANPNHKIMLIGRASTIGGNLLYNRLLSGRRALAVKDELMTNGISESLISTMWFGWEPPQISDDIADEYKWGRFYREVGQKRMNQSVVMALYDADAGQLTGK